MTAEDFELLCPQGRAMYELAKKRGLRLERVGVAWRLSGPGVWVSVANPKQLSRLDMRAPPSGEHGAG